MALHSCLLYRRPVVHEQAFAISPIRLVGVFPKSPLALYLQLEQEKHLVFFLSHLVVDEYLLGVEPSKKYA